MFLGLINNDITPEIVRDFLLTVYCESSLDMSLPRSASNMVLVHSQSDYAFSSSDLMWLSYAPVVLTCDTGYGYDMFCLKVECADIEYYEVCAALIKILSRAFKQRFVCLFRFDGSIAYGCKRFADEDYHGSFCITQQFAEQQEDRLEEFLEELQISEFEDIASLIIRYSPQEGLEEGDLYNGNAYDRRRFDSDYLLFLSELTSAYGVSTASEVERYTKEYTGDRSRKTTYQKTVEELAGVADEDDVSSYETLDEAVEAEEKYTLLQRRFEISDDSSERLVEENERFSKAAFSKADVMLDEMLNK